MATHKEAQWSLKANDKLVKSLMIWPLACRLLPPSSLARCPTSEIFLHWASLFLCPLINVYLLFVCPLISFFICHFTSFFLCLSIDNFLCLSVYNSLCLVVCWYLSWRNIWCSVSVHLHGEALVAINDASQDEHVSPNLGSTSTSHLRKNEKCNMKFKIQWL